jgi:hypothetical protein
MKTYIVVSATAVAANLFQPLDVQSGVAPKVTLDRVFIHLLTQFSKLIFREVLGALVINALQRVILILAT